jgi:hypothetical protein
VALVTTPPGVRRVRCVASPADIILREEAGLPTGRGQVALASASCRAGPGWAVMGAFLEGTAGRAWQRELSPRLWRISRRAVAAGVRLR